MTKKELKKLNRTDLIEMLLVLSMENEQLKADLEEARKQLADRTLSIENIGSLAEAAMALNGVFEAAQAAADQYIQNIQQRSEQQKEICEQMEQETREKCSRMMLAAKKQADDYLLRANAEFLKQNDADLGQTETHDDTQQTETQETV